MQVVWGIMGYDFRALHSVLSLWNSDIFAVSEKQRNQTVESKYLTLTTLMKLPNKGLSVFWLTGYGFVRSLSGRPSGPAHISDTSPAIHLSPSLSRLCTFHFDKCTRTGRSCRTVGGGEGSYGSEKGGLDLIDKCLRVAFTARSHFVCVHTDCTYWMSVRFILSFCEATTWTAHLNSTLMFDWD